MIVIPVASLPHRVAQRAEWRVAAIEAGDEAGETLERAVRRAVGGARSELERELVARRLAALALHVDERRHAGAARNIRKAAAAKNRGFERELRRQSGAHLFLAGHLAGLVVDDHVAAVGQLVDAVGAPREPEAVTDMRDVALPADLRPAVGEAGAPRRVPAEDPGRDALEARPPER